MSLKDFKAKGGSVEGLTELAGNLNWTPREALALVRATQRGMASEVRRRMRLRIRGANIGKRRTLEKAIVVYSPRQPRDQAIIDVKVTHGRGAKYDAFWWHWLEWPTQNQYMPTVPFINPTVEEFRREQPAIMREQFGKKLESAMKRRAKKRS